MGLGGDWLWVADLNLGGFVRSGRGGPSYSGLWLVGGRLTLGGFVHSGRGGPSYRRPLRRPTSWLQPDAVPVREVPQIGGDAGPEGVGDDVATH